MLISYFISLKYTLFNFDQFRLQRQDYKGKEIRSVIRNWNTIFQQGDEASYPSPTICTISPLLSINKKNKEKRTASFPKIKVIITMRNSGMGGVLVNEKTHNRNQVQVNNPGYGQVLIGLNSNSCC